MNNEQSRFNELIRSTEQSLKEDRATGADRGGAARMKDYNEVYRQTRDHRAAIRSYCAGNVWATENAKAVGNW